MKKHSITEKEKLWWWVFLTGAILFALFSPFSSPYLNKISALEIIGVGLLIGLLAARYRKLKFVTFVLILSYLLVGFGALFSRRLFSNVPNADYFIAFVWAYFTGGYFTSKFLPKPKNK